MDDGDDFDPALDRLDHELYGREPDEPSCFDCFDRRPAGASCPGCAPSPREERRERHREWQRRDRQSRAGKPPPVFDPLSPTFGDRAPF